jgi:hypothetical protein
MTSTKSSTSSKRLRKRYGHARLSAAQKVAIAEDISSAASDNAYNTEEVPRDDARDHGPLWAKAFIASLEMIRDSIQSEREYMNYAVPRVLTAKEAHAIVDPLIKQAW